jgi:hypothetical protein
MYKITIEDIEDGVSWSYGPTKEVVDQHKEKLKSLEERLNSVCIVDGDENYDDNPHARKKPVMSYMEFCRRIIGMFNDGDGFFDLYNSIKEVSYAFDVDGDIMVVPIEVLANSNIEVDVDCDQKFLRKKGTGKFIEGGSFYVYDAKLPSMGNRRTDKEQFTPFTSQSMNDLYHLYILEKL